MPDLVVVVPTRGRPSNARGLAQAFASMCTADTRLILAVDNDDPTLPDYSDIPRQFPLVEMRMCGPWQPMVPKLDEVAAAVAAEEPFAVAFMGDDHKPRTPGWDSAMLVALHELGTGVVYGDDLLQRERLCTAWAMTSDIVRALGRMVPAPVEHMYCDNAVMELARAAGCLRYLPGVVIEHMHPLARKADWDPGYARVNRAEQFQIDEQVWRTYLAGPFVSDVEKVRALRGVTACL